MAETPSSFRVALGESIFDVAARHPGLFGIDTMLDNSPALVVRPVTPTIGGAGPDLALPPTRFVNISQAAGIVTAVFTSPTLSLLPLEAAHDLALRLMLQVEAAEWKATLRQPLTDLAPFKAKAIAADGKYGTAYAEYRRGSADLSLGLTRPAGVVAGDQQAWLVDFELSDRAIEEQANALLFKRRDEMPSGAIIPLSTFRRN